MYIRLEIDTVAEIIPDYDESFPGVSIENRYSKEFMSKLIHIDDGIDVEVGYKFSRGEFIKPEITETIPNNSEENTVVFPNESAHEIKLKELSNECTKVIYGGTDVTLSDGTTEHFTLDNEDQLNLSGIALKIIMGDTDISWHSDDKTIPCKNYSIEDAKIIIATLTAFKEYHITYFRDLRIYLHSIEDLDLMKNIPYGFELPESAKSDVLKNLEKKISDQQQKKPDSENTVNYVDTEPIIDSESEGATE